MNSDQVSLECVSLHRGHSCGAERAPAAAGGGALPEPLGQGDRYGDSAEQAVNQRTRVE